MNWFSGKQFVQLSLVSFIWAICTASGTAQSLKKTLNSPTCMFASDGRIGFLNQMGTAAITPTFHNARNFSNGLAPVAVGDKWGYIDISGSIVIRPQFTFADGFNSLGVAAATSGEKWGLIDRRGRWVVPPRYSRLSYHDGIW